MSAWEDHSHRKLHLSTISVFLFIMWTAPPHTHTHTYSPLLSLIQTRSDTHHKEKNVTTLLTKLASNLWWSVEMAQWTVTLRSSSSSSYATLSSPFNLLMSFTHWWQLLSAVARRSRASSCYEELALRQARQSSPASDNRQLFSAVAVICIIKASGQS